MVIILKNQTVIISYEYNFNEEILDFEFNINNNYFENSNNFNDSMPNYNVDGHKVSDDEMIGYNDSNPINELYSGYFFSFITPPINYAFKKYAIVIIVNTIIIMLEI